MTVVRIVIAIGGRAGSGVPVGAISITGLKATMPTWQVAEFGARVLSAANQIAVAIGGRPIDPAPGYQTEGSSDG